MMNENWEEVIWRALRNECSAEELEQLQNWRNESSDNERMYADIKRLTGIGTFLKGVDSLHKKQALENVLKQTRRRAVIRFRWLRSTAAILFPLLLAGTLFYLFGVKDRSDEVVPISIVKPILPGGPKAVLYLSDGQVVDLNQVVDSVIVDGSSGQ